MKAILIPTVIMALYALPLNNQLTGRWQSKPAPNGNVTGIVFKTDNSFEGYINRKPFVTGQYTLQDNIFSFVDNGCDGQRGVYKVVFFNNADSIRFEPINDSCTRRKDGMIRLVLGRVK
jgi:hypothetical protein